MTPVTRKTARSPRRRPQALDWDAVREIGLALPDAEEGTTYGTPALKVRGQMFACIPSHRSAEPDSLAMRIPFEQRDELLDAEPDTYYVKEHYQNYAVVLVRLALVHPDALRDLLRGAHQFILSNAKRTRRRRTAGAGAPPAVRRRK